tara:strand:+ start:13294 stop:14076 length:783 start_codon:yes stop_codon:yes gene_type:complete
MNRIIKLNTDQCNIWFASDFHLDHDKEFVWGARGFENVVDHKNFILWRSNVAGTSLQPDKKENILVYLGDFSLSSTLIKTTRSLDFIAKSYDKVYYIPGNHESYIRNIKKTVRILKNFINGYSIERCINFLRLKDQEYLEYLQDRVGSDIDEYLRFCISDNIRKIEWLGTITNFSIDKKKVVCCHYPILSWDEMYHGSWHLHGHEHGSIQTSWITHNHGKILDVGVDVNLKLTGDKDVLASWDYIKEQMNLKEVKSVGHH